MSFSPSFTVTQVAGSESEVVLTDNSTGSDGNITQRRVYIATDTGEFLVESGTSTEYEAWAYADSSITLDVLDKDYAVRIVVQWLDVSNVVLYDYTVETGLTLYNETFDYSLTKILSSNPLQMNDDSFFGQKSELRTCIDSGNQAIDLATDLYAAQQCYDRATNIRLNSVYSFNTNA